MPCAHAAHATGARAPRALQRSLQRAIGCAARAHAPRNTRRGRASCAALDAAGSCGRARRLLAVELEVLVGFELVLLVLVVVVAVGRAARRRAGRSTLEAARSARRAGARRPATPRRSAPSRSPSKSVALEDLVVDLGRVVDDDHDLGLRVEVGARADRQLVELEAARVAHGAFIPDRAVPVRRVDGRRVARSRVELVERALRPRPRRRAAPGPGARAVRCARPPAGGPPRRARVVRRLRCARRRAAARPRRRCRAPARRGAPGASLRACSIWRISCSCSARAARRESGARREARRRRRRPRRESPPCADLVVHAAAAREQEQQRHHDRERHGAEDDDREGALQREGAGATSDCCRSRVRSATLPRRID